MKIRNLYGNDRAVKGKGRSGFAVMLVIGAMIFMTAAIVGLSTLFAHEVRRTRAALAETQLRQLLLAGVSTTQMDLAVYGAGERDIAMTVPVDGAVMVLHLTGNGASAEARIAGTYRGFKGSQVVRFARDASGAWKVADARLDQTGQQ